MVVAVMASEAAATAEAAIVVIVVVIITAVTVTAVVLPSFNKDWETNGKEPPRRTRNRKPVTTQGTQGPHQRGCQGSEAVDQVLEGLDTWLRIPTTACITCVKGKTRFRSFKVGSASSCL